MSSTEVQNVYSNTSTIKSLDMQVTSVQLYEDQHYQPTYFVSHSFQKTIDDFRWVG